MVLPYVEFSEQSPEWHPWQVIDRGQYDRKMMGQDVIDVLTHARELLKTRRNVTWFDPSARRPTPAQCERIKNILRGDFERFASFTALAGKKAVELKRYTEEQFDALYAMRDNPRVLFAGLAGTGKTLLALEAARRARVDGRRTLLICFNRLLSAWLKERAGELAPGATVGTLHSFMLGAVGASAPEGADAAFWSHDLPEMASEALSAGGGACEYNELIVDEAQDVANDSYLNVLDVCLKGGTVAILWRL